MWRDLSDMQARHVPPRPRWSDRLPDDGDTRLATAIALLPGGMGLLILLAGERAFHAASLYVARSVMPWWVWGVALLAYTPALWLTRRLYVRWIFVASGSFVWAFFGVTFLASWLIQPTDKPYAADPALYPVWLYGWLSFAFYRLAKRFLDSHPSGLDKGQPEA